MHIIGFPVAIGLLAFVAAASLWRYKRTHRIAAWLFAAAAFFLTVGVLPWRNSLAELIAPASGLVVLLCLDVVSGVGFWHEAIRKHMHHRIRTPVLGIMFGVCVVLTVADFARISRKALQSPAKTSSAIGRAMTQVSNGHAAHASGGHQQALTVFAIGCAVVVLLIIVAHKHESSGGRGGQRALPAAPPRGGSARGTSGRAAPVPLPSGRRGR